MLSEHEMVDADKVKARAGRGQMRRGVMVLAVLGLAALSYSGAVAVGACQNPYTVQPGDWLLKIAAACGVDPQAMLAANSSLADPNQIQPGQQLALPVPEGGAAPAAEPAAETAEQAAQPAAEAASQAEAPVAVAVQPVEPAAQPAAASAANGSTLVFGASADGFVAANHPHESFGRSTILRADGATEQSYLTFDVVLPEGATVTGASLRVYAHGSSPSGVAVHAAGSGGWDEGSLTHASAPGLGGLLGASGPHGGSRYVDIGLGGFVTGSGRYSVALANAGDKPVAFSSREAGAGRPELIVVVGGDAPPVEPTQAPPAEPTQPPPVEPTQAPPVEPTPVPPQPTQPAPTQAPPAIGNPLACDITNIAWSAEGRLLRGGRPDAGDLACLAAAGVDVLVDQRAPGEVDYDEGAAARALGLEYINLGIPDDTAPSPGTLRAWIDTVNARLAEGKVVLVHDRAGRGRMGFWDAVYGMLNGVSPRDAIENRYLGRGYDFSGAKIGCGDGGNGQVQALAEISQALTGQAYWPSTDEYGTRWQNCARPGYMDGWDYGGAVR